MIELADRSILDTRHRPILQVLGFVHLQSISGTSGIRGLRVVFRRRVVFSLVPKRRICL